MLCKHIYCFQDLIITYSSESSLHTVHTYIYYLDSIFLTSYITYMAYNTLNSYVAIRGEVRNQIKKNKKLYSYWYDMHRCLLKLPFEIQCCPLPIEIQHKPQFVQSLYIVVKCLYRGFANYIKSWEGLGTRLVPVYMLLYKPLMLLHTVCVSLDTRAHDEHVNDAGAREGQRIATNIDIL